MAVNRSLNALQFLGIMALTAVAALALTLKIPGERYLRFQQLTDTIQYQSLWVYQRLHFDPTPVDVAIVGASRILYGVNAPLLEKQLAARGLPGVHVANLALPQAGFDLAAVLEREAVQAKHPKVVIAMAIEKFPREGHPAFKELADVRDLVQAPVLVNLTYVEDLMRGAYRQLKLAVVAIDPPFFGYDRDFDTAHYAGTEVDTTKDETLPDGHVIRHSAVHSREFIEADARRYRASLRPSPFGRRLQPYEFAVSTKAYRDMARYAAEGHARFFILFESYYKGPERAAENDFLQSLAPVVPADWSNDDYRLFMDSRHRNAAGADLVTAKLADILAQQYRAQLSAAK